MNVTAESEGSVRLRGGRLVLRQVRFTNKAFWRNPAAAFFTFAFPLMFLVIFTSVFGHGQATLPDGRTVNTSTFYVASIVAFSVITACYTNIAMSVAFSRDQGVLKRIRGTPLPAWAYLLARILHAVLVAILLVVICVVFGRAVYRAHVPFDTFLPFAVTFVVGAASFCTLALATVSFVPNADSAPAIVNAIILPLLFLSDVFIPIPPSARVVNAIASVFPVKYLTAGLDASFFPMPGQSAFHPVDLAIVAAWGVFGLVVAIRRFSWEPRR